jgi:hypothetical protein
MHTSTLRHLFTLAVLLLFLPNTINAQTKAPEKPQVIKLQRFRKALWKVHVTVKGKSGDFLLDTGGGVTLLTEAFSKGIDCEFWGRTTGFNMFGKKSEGPHCDDVQLMAGDIALTPVNVGKIDFEGQFPGDIAPDGLLSLDAFDGKVITLDQTTATLTIETPKSLANRAKRMQELSLRISRECSARCLSVFLGVPTAKGMTWLILDSGAGGVSLISKDHAELFGLDPNGKDQRLVPRRYSNTNREPSSGNGHDHGRKPRPTVYESVCDYLRPGPWEVVDREKLSGSTTRWPTKHNQIYKSGMWIVSALLS